MANMLALLRYLPLVIEVGKLVLQVVKEIEKMKEVRDALKTAKAGDPAQLQSLVAGMGKKDGSAVI